MSQSAGEVRPAEIGDIPLIAHNMRQVDRDEVRASHGVSPLAALSNSFRASDEVLTGTVDGVPVCMFGVSPRTLTVGGGIPWMLATPEIETVSIKLLRTSKRWVDAKLSEYGVLTNYVDARNETSIRWLQWLGFSFSPAAPYGVAGLPFHKFTMRRY